MCTDSDSEARNAIGCAVEKLMLDPAVRTVLTIDKNEYIGDSDNETV